MVSASPAITVVGGGTAGLVAAISCAEAGFHVRLHEARRRLGGRARSTDGEWAANFGPHALCSARTNWSWLEERGLLPTTAWISPTGSRFHHHGRVSRTPPAALLAGVQIGFGRALEALPAPPVIVAVEASRLAVAWAGALQGEACAFTT